MTFALRQLGHFWYLLVIAYMAASVLPAHGVWYDYKIPGSTTNGIYQDVLSHCTAEGRQKMYDPDPLTWCHESTHEVNSNVRNQIGGNVNAFYVGGNKACVLPEPRVTLSTVAQYVPANRRTATFNLYLVQQARGWQNQPLYILDEYSAYINGAQAGKEMGRPRGSDFQHCEEFAFFADCLVAAVKQHDPAYPALGDLEEFIAHQNGRVAAMVGPAQQVAQSCVDCNRGWCPVPQGPRIVVKPVQQQSPPRPQAASYTDPQWVAWRKQIETQIAAIKPCQCDHSNQITKADLEAAIAKIQLKPGPAGPPGPPGPPGEAGKPGETPQVDTAGESHIVVVVDRNASWWPRLSEDIEKTRDSYSGIQIAGLPSFPIGEIPQAVVYENSVPVRVVKGEREVLDLLSRVRRGAAI